MNPTLEVNPQAKNNLETPQNTVDVPDLQLISHKEKLEVKKSKTKDDNMLKKHLNCSLLV